MTCQTCGRPAENGQATHWLGCEEVNEAEKPRIYAELCEFGDCGMPKWSHGPRAKFCEIHKNPKNRETS